MIKQLTNIPALRFPEFTGEWEKKKLGEVAEKINSGKTPLGGDSVYSESGILFIRSQNVNDDKLSFENSTFISEKINDTMKNSVVKANDILLNITGASLGRSCVVPENFTIGNVNQHVCIIRLKKESNPRFVQPILSSTKGQNNFISLQTGSGREGLNFESIKGMEISFPTLPEQTKIATFLTAVDEKIQALKKKKGLLEAYKKGVMQQLFFVGGRDAINRVSTRFKDENGADFPDWEVKKLGEEIIEFKENSKLNNQFKVLTSSNQGLMLQSEYYGENRLTGRENTGFNIIPHGYITYRSRSDTGIFTFNLNTLGYTGIISTYYPVFKIKKGDNKFLVEYLNFYKTTISKFSVGTSQRVLALSLFNEIQLAFPIKEEQTRIANFLSAIDDKISQTQMQIEKTEEWKKGLLQKMFV